MTVVLLGVRFGVVKVGFKAAGSNPPSLRGFSEQDWPNGAGSVGEKCCGRLFSPQRSRSKQALKEFGAANLKFTKLS